MAAAAVRIKIKRISLGRDDVEYSTSCDLIPG